MSLSWNTSAPLSTLDHLNTSDMELGERTFTRQCFVADGQEQVLPTYPQIHCTSPVTLHTGTKGKEKSLSVVLKTDHPLKRVQMRNVLCRTKD